MKKITCEVCVETVDDAIRAEQAGADRIELCADLAVGGTTPSAGLIRTTAKQVSIPVMVMIRPRPGDFCFSEHEKTTMMRDIQYAAESEISGVVIGALTNDNRIDVACCQSLLEVTGELDVTFHRAFDLVENPLQAFDSIIEMGIKRVLTSGTESTAEKGAILLRQLVERGQGKISVMPGAGVNERNVVTILRETNASEIHFSGRRLGDDSTDRFGFGEHFVTDGDRVANICSAVNRFCNDN